MFTFVVLHVIVVSFFQGVATENRLPIWHAPPDLSTPPSAGVMQQRKILILVWLQGLWVQVQEH